VHTVIETPAFLASAKDIGVTAEEREAIVTLFASSPDIGDLMPGSGGARKVRIAGRGKGKRGGYRVISFFAAEDIPVFLLGIYAKGSKADLGQSEKAELRGILTRLPQAWRDGVRRRTIR
jgi:hypothetical protein